VQAQAGPLNSRVSIALTEVSVTFVFCWEKTGHFIDLSQKSAVTPAA
jgi:hypothetical protein